MDPPLLSLRVRVLKPCEFGERRVFARSLTTTVEALGLLAVALGIGAAVFESMIPFCAMLPITWPAVVMGSAFFGLWFLAGAGRAGWLHLEQHALRFVPAGEGAELRIPLADLVRIGRLGRYLHLALRPRGDWYVRCPRLRAEDLFDHLVEALEAGGHDCESYEADRRCP